MAFGWPTPADPRAPLPSANAVAKLGAALTVIAVAVLSRDPVTPGVLLAGVAAVTILVGLRPLVLARRLAPLIVAAVVLGALNALLAGTPIGSSPGGEPDRLTVGIALGLRVAVIAWAGTLFVITTDPADLAAGLIAYLRVSPRLAIGALAALRLVPVLANEWRTIGLARRARGVDAGRSPLAAARLALASLVSLLVTTIRRATRLALAMDARGFDSRRARTQARPPRMRGADWALLGAAAALGVTAMAVSVALGSWRFLFG